MRLVLLRKRRQVLEKSRLPCVDLLNQFAEDRGDHHGRYKDAEDIYDVSGNARAADTQFSLDKILVLISSSSAISWVRSPSMRLFIVGSATCYYSSQLSRPGSVRKFVSE